jgi:hypothetical protein
MTGESVVTRLDKVYLIEGADRVVRAELLGETVIVGKDEQLGQLGLLFDIETALSPEFLSNNNLYKDAERNVDKTKSGYFESKGRVRPIKLKGIKVSGFWIPLSSLNYIKNLPELKEGQMLTSVGDNCICWKYQPPTKPLPIGSKLPKQNLVPTFKEHFETDHITKSIGDIPLGPFVVTKKLHGTSGRYGKLLRPVQPRWYEKLFNLFKPQQYVNVVGSRRMVKSVDGATLGGPNWYDSDIWSKVCYETFGDNLLEGETVYFEIVGYEGTNTIMPSVGTDKLKSLLDAGEYAKVEEKYGKKIHYTYGMEPGQYDVYIYRITQTTPQGESIDLSWEQVKKRSTQLGVKFVPEIAVGFRWSPNVFSLRELTGANVVAPMMDCRDFSDAVEWLAARADHHGTHPEGICLRAESYPNCKVWKHKCKNFRFLEFGQTDSGEVSIEEVN